MKFSILFGGLSWEHEISIVSAISLKKVLGEKNVEGFIFLDSSHRFYLIPSESMKSTFFSSGEYKKCKELYVGIGSFFSQGLLKKKSIPLGIVINLIHGADGEDGTLASILDFYKIPFIGPRLEGCVLSFNKYLTKLYAKERGIKMLPFEMLQKHSPRKINGEFPLIVKPSRLGSSIGVSVIYSSDEISYAIDSAFEFDKEIIIEPFIKGVKEYNLAGCKIADGNNSDDEYIFSIIEEPQKKDLLDFENKYLDFSRTEQVRKADISEDLEKKIKDAFKKIYVNKFEGALIRCDFFVIEDEVYLNEINPIPGSGANYLFDNFLNTLLELSSYLPKKEAIKISYQYIDKIQRAKGK
ncbi:D-alanine--D-alanine ligase [Helicobacter cappadocius]|uniref:D-alanine--D-alanine ligase n=1 Tax=Helicobacter cappadocius TaxID=3063998 RepID=A0AA90PXK9_9HELI|nr:MULTISPECIES: D-alanine--D-alanine ligase [unclassified Helicobacter]MDO7252546.1 D-alanine--D-alanine ligase [Helicobacter sp. faydin-H75]MDP2538413.1 D-alanine--D-alanine ligase [Helicobacter sp. faydin-H76]